MLNLQIKIPKMRAHVFQHLPFERPGNIVPWLLNAGYEITYTYFYEDQRIPTTHEIDFLVIMGGSMSVNDEQKHPWLVKEKQFIRDFIATQKPVLGICLGAQLVASSLGAKVYPNKEKEIGWFPVKGTKLLPQSCFQFPASFLPLHWHGETFDLPDGAVLLASSEATENQAFQVGKNVLALQFHPEANRETLKDFCYYFRKELVPGKFIQDENQIFSYGDEYLSLMDELLQEVLSYLLRK
jgi:GMP synthase-like glutamine amidotransferase